MTLIDTIILLIVLGGLVIGYRKGLFKQLASIISWVVGITVTLLLGDEVTKLFLALNPSAADWPLSGITVKVVALSLFFLLVTLVLGAVAQDRCACGTFGMCGQVGRRSAVCVQVCVPAEHSPEPVLCL